MKTILISGFEPFDTHLTNPSMQVVQDLNGHIMSNGTRIVGCILPVVQNRSADVLLQQIDHHKPSAIVALGVAHRASISLERVALNIDDFSIPDQDGHTPKDESIIPSAPIAYWSTLPIKELFAQIQGLNIPVEISNSAGTYVCNHLFFKLQHALRDHDIPSGFIHVPTVQTLALHQQCLAILTVAQWLARCV